jgi:hypothetical protein
MRRLTALSLAFVALIAAPLAGSASATSNRPILTVSAGTPAGTGITVTATINRSPKQVASCLYGVDAAPSIDCGAEAPDGTGTAIMLILVDQGPGEHAINVQVTLTDGGGATGSAGFTIEAPHATLDVTKTEDGGSPTDAFQFQLTGGPDNVDIALTTQPRDGNLEWANLAAGDYTLCERGMPAAMHSSLEDAPYNGSRQPDGTSSVKICVSITLAAAQPLSIAVDNVNRLFAVAWTDTNGDHTYEAAADSLIAKLVDTNGDGVVNAGDTVTTNQFPRDHDGTAFEPATVTTFDVTSVPIANSGEIVVGTMAGLFAWISQGDLEQYQELTPSIGTIVLIDDPAQCDQIRLEENSPSEIATPSIDVTCDDADNPFLDVTVDYP